jgi:ABC-type uncharacterized transport system substrate-binding protein
LVLRLFVTTLRDLGWIESKTVIFDYRWPEQRYDRFPALAQALNGLGLDLIVITAGVTAALAAKQATTTLPFVAVAVADPVKSSGWARACPSWRQYRTARALRCESATGFSPMNSSMRL